MGKFAVLVERVGIVILAGAAAALLHYYGDLGSSASMLLGVAFTIIGLWLYGLKEIATFKPYRLVIGVNYETLWEDLNLMPTAEGPKFENVTLTAISAAIFARSDERAYSVKLDIYKDIPCGGPAWTGFGSNTPTFFLRPVHDGYQFGVHVQEEWWKLHSSQVAQAIRDKPLAYDGTLALGLLPYGYMPEHVRRWNEVVSLWYGFDRKQRRWNKRLQQGGWSLSDDHPTYLTHRYVGIGYYDL